MKTMGTRIQEMRTKCNMTQEELGDKLGVLRQTIGKWEAGDVQNIKRSYIAKMADMFHCDPVWLMGFDGAPEVGLTYTAPDKESVMVTVDHMPIVGENSLRAKLYQAAVRVRTENLQTAIEVLESLS